MQSLSTKPVRSPRQCAARSARRRIAALITAGRMLLAVATLATAAPSSGKPKSSAPATTTPTPTATPTPTTESCWSPSGEPVGPETTWSASETTGGCAYRFEYLSGLGWVMFSANAWVWIYEPAVDADDPVAFNYAATAWTLYISEPNATDCGTGADCGSEGPLPPDAEPEPIGTP